MALFTTYKYAKGSPCVVQPPSIKMTTREERDQFRLGYCVYLIHELFCCPNWALFEPLLASRLEMTTKRQGVK
jgi:hypothetical protein